MLRWIHRYLLLGCTSLIAIPIACHAIVTSDGPVHLAFSNLIATLNQPNHPLQQQAYQIHLRLNPNLAVYLLMSALLRVCSASATESIVQLLCVVGLVGAAYYALDSIETGNAWLAVFVLPLAMNQMFYLGLYNHCLSMAAFFLAIGTYYWMMKAPSAPRAAALSATLALTFLCHASGFIMAVTGIGVMSGIQFALSLRRNRNFLAALKEQRYALTALLAPMPIAALFLLSNTSTSTTYGVSLLSRLKQFVTLQLLVSNFPLERYVALALSGILSTAIVLASVKMVRRGPAKSRDRWQVLISTISAMFASILVMLAFPDNMGGGWTHFRRFELFPFFWGLLVLAFYPFPRLARIVLTTTGAAISLLLGGAMLFRQATVREGLAPLAEVDRRVGDHCSILPIVTEGTPRENNGSLAWMAYDPYYQSASRLELAKDRVVLFNFLARLNVYPVEFYPNMEPQSHIFHWKLRQEHTAFDTIDLAGFESESGMRVDSILPWGDLEAAPEKLREEIRAAITEYNVTYRSPDGRVTLYQRRNGGNSTCQAIKTE